MEDIRVSPIPQLLPCAAATLTQNCLAKGESLSIMPHGQPGTRVGPGGSNAVGGIAPTVNPRRRRSAPWKCRYRHDHDRERDREAMISTGSRERLGLQNGYSDP